MKIRITRVLTRGYGRNTEDRPMFNVTRYDENTVHKWAFVAQDFLTYEEAETFAKEYAANFKEIFIEI